MVKLTSTADWLLTAYRSLGCSHFSPCGVCLTHVWMSCHSPCCYDTLPLSVTYVSLPLSPICAFSCLSSMLMFAPHLPPLSHVSVLLAHSRSALLTPTEWLCAAEGAGFSLSPCLYQFCSSEGHSLLSSQMLSLLAALPHQFLISVVISTPECFVL